MSALLFSLNFIGTMVVPLGRFIFRTIESESWCHCWYDIAPKMSCFICLVIRLHLQHVIVKRLHALEIDYAILRLETPDLAGI